MYCDMERVMRLLECEKTSQIYCCYEATGDGKGSKGRESVGNGKGKERAEKGRAWKGGEGEGRTVKKGMTSGIHRLHSIACVARQ